MSCFHEWVFVSPVPVRWLECPKCELSMGKPKYPFEGSEDALIPNCNSCGSIHMQIYWDRYGLHVCCLACAENHDAILYDDGSGDFEK